MKAIISVVGKDKTGILALVSGECMKFNGNIEDVSQTILQDVFTMVMIVEVAKQGDEFVAFVDHMENVGKMHGLVIRVMHEDIFKAMHTI